MFGRRIETDHLMSIDRAKECFIKLLTPRVEAYEQRLKKPFYERGFEYLKTSYGEEGYKRTKLFLSAMSGVHRSEELINLTKQPLYQEGCQMPVLLKLAAIEVCGFQSEHMDLIERDLLQEIMYKTSTYEKLRLLMLREEAIDSIYQCVISSPNYGRDYLLELNSRLDGVPCCREMTRL